MNAISVLVLISSSPFMFALITILQESFNQSNLQLPMHVRFHHDTAKIPQSEQKRWDKKDGLEHHVSTVADLPP